MSTTPPIEDFELHMPDDIDVEHCYRHPDRETGVHCSHCGRPICHECMTPAPVGFRCPECMAEQRRSFGSSTRSRVVTRQQTRSRWQQRGGVYGGSSGLSATKALIGINVLVFLVEVATGAGSLSLFGAGNGDTLLRMGALLPYDVIVRHEYWRMFTMMFLHLDLAHIFFNMLALWFLGEFTENVLGRAKFIVLYFVSGFAGSVLVLLFAPAGALTVGASGAIAGVFGGLMAYAYLNRHRDYVARAIFGQLVFWFFLNLVINVYSVSQPGGGSLSWQGHLGGFVTGALLMAAYTLFGRKSPHGRFSTGDLAFTAAIVVVLVALTYWKVETATLGAFIPWL
jgi:membrane associated rhomboid family serine protease